MVRNVDDGGIYRFAGGAPLLVRCDLGAGCVEPDADRQRHVRAARLDRRRATACASTRPTARPSATSTTAPSTASRAARRSRSRAAPAARRSMIDNRTLRLAGTGDPGHAAHGCHAAGRHLPHDRHGAPTGSPAARPSSSRTARRSAAARGRSTSTPARSSASAADACWPRPKDGTVLRGLPSKRTWEIVGGKRRETFVARLDAIDVDDGAIGLIPSTTHADARAARAGGVQAGRSRAATRSSAATRGSRR